MTWEDLYLAQARGAWLVWENEEDPPGFAERRLVTIENVDQNARFVHVAASATTQFGFSRIEASNRELRLATAEDLLTLD